jgi:MFS family permease
VRSVARAVVDDAGLERWLRPADGLVRERADGDRRFGLDEGPFRRYERTVAVQPAGDGRHEVTSTVDFRLAIPYVGWLVALPVAAWLRRPGAPLPWWGPPARLDARSAGVLGTLCGFAVVGGYLGTAITQTITFAADDFGHTSNRPQAMALATVRLAVVIALVLVAAADRRGRRALLIVAAVAGVLFSATTALAPSLPFYAGSQILTRGCSTALAVLITVVAAEEMPAGARAFAVSVLGMCAALGAGFCVMALPLADLDTGGWRLVFVLPLLGLPLLRDAWRRLPESRRFGAPHAASGMAGHGARLRLLATAALLINLFAAPASQLQNEFLRDERGYTAAGITLFTLVTNTPAGIGVLVGGRLADARGRRIVGAVSLAGGVGATVVMFFSAGASLWAWSLVGAVVGGATLPALGVYGPELFPTGSRARANGLIALAAVVGSSTGLVAAGILSDRLGGLAPALAILAVGPALLTLLVLLRFPETARVELEDLNPQDRRP